MRVLITGGMGVIGAEASRKFVREGHRPVLYSRHRDESPDPRYRRQGRYRARLHSRSRAACRSFQIARHHARGAHRRLYQRAVGQASGRERRDQCDGHGQRAGSGAGGECRARRLYQRQGRLWPVPRRLRLADLQARAPRIIRRTRKRIYDSAKLMGENATLYWGTLGLDVVVLRFATTYGPGKTSRHGNMGVTSQIIEQPASGQPFRHRARRR